MKLNQIIIITRKLFGKPNIVTDTQETSRFSCLVKAIK